MAQESNPASGSRRQFVRAIGALAASLSPLAAGARQQAAADGPTVAAGPRPLVSYPGKRPLLLVHSRPPHLETPFAVFDEGPLTPNDAFFVRYHLPIPTAIDPAAYRLSVTGTVKTPLRLSLADLKAMPGQAEVVAVNQCSGNSRGYASPRVFGAQLGNGSMGNARWTGVPLKAVLERAGVGAAARYVTFNGLDAPALPTTPDFRKALEIDHALSAEPLLAWSMNGADLPFLNGYPIRLVVPGYFGTYWVKHLSEIEVIDRPFEGHDAFFMTRAYRVPDNDCACVSPGMTPEKTRPITTLAVRSFTTSVKAGDTIPAGRAMELKGIAFDGGSGIASVAVSIDAGRSWRPATLGPDLGRFSFREWRLPMTFAAAGGVTVMVRATSKAGAVQPMEATWNPAGYLRNVVESTPLSIV